MNYVGNSYLLAEAERILPFLVQGMGLAHAPSIETLMLDLSICIDAYKANPDLRAAFGCGFVMTQQGSEFIVSVNAGRVNAYRLGFIEDQEAPETQPTQEEVALA